MAPGKHDTAAAAAPDSAGPWHGMAGHCQEKETLWANTEESRAELKDEEGTGYHTETTKDTG